MRRAAAGILIVKAEAAAFLPAFSVGRRLRRFTPGDQKSFSTGEALCLNVTTKGNETLEKDLHSCVAFGRN